MENSGDLPTPVPVRSTGERAWAAFWWTAKIALLYAVLRFLLWQYGCRATARGVPVDAEDLLAAVLIMGIVAPAGAILIAVAKPWCTSYLRCVVVAYIGGIPLYAAALLVILGTDGLQLTMETVTGPLIGAPLLGWMLWQYAKEGENWHWPFPDPNDD